jgi:hypothetical protein
VFEWIFRLVASHVAVEGHVVIWYPPRSDVKPGGELEDIALLELTTEPPAEANPAPMLQKTVLDHQVRMFGFPPDLDLGHWVFGRILGPTTKGWLQVAMESGAREDSRGYSGTPVWDDQEKAVVGMIGAISQKEVVFYMIPTQSLVKAWPDFPVSDRAAENSQPAARTPENPRVEQSEAAAAERMPTQADDPAKIDELGRRPFAQVLRARIDEVWGDDSPGSSKLRGGFMMHIDGPWGSGKTSLLNLSAMNCKMTPKRKAVIGSS